MKDPDTVQEMVRRRVRRRRLRRRARVAGLVVTVAIAAGGAAFGIDRMVVSLRKYYAAPAHSTGSTTTTVSGPTTTTASGPPNCVSGQLSGAVTNWQGINGTMYQTVSLTNISLSPCTLLGYPGLAVNSQNGTALPAATQDVATMGASTGAAPAAPTAIVVAPEARAWFELSYPDVCNDILTPGAGPTAIPDACYEGKWLQITPPKTASPLLVLEPLRFTYGVVGFDVGPFGTGSPPAVARKLTIPWTRVDPRASGSAPGARGMATRETPGNEYEQACLAEDLGQDVLALAAVAASHRPASVIRRVNGRLVRLIVEAA